MKTKTFVFALLLAAPLAASAGAEEPLATNAVLQSVVVYRAGAELTHTASAVLPAGNVALAIDGVSTGIDLNSVQIHVPSTMTLLGFTYVNNYLEPRPRTARQERLEDSLGRLTESQEKIQLAMTDNDDLLAVLRQNRELKGASTGMNVADLVKLMDYYKAKSGELTEMQYELKKRYTAFQENIDRVKDQIKEEENANTRESGRLLLRLAVTTAGNADFTVSYITGNAGWTPAYELQVRDAQDSVRVLYKANINQTTGLDWKQVKMALSTSVPGSWSQAPELNPFFIGFEEKYREADIEGKVAGAAVSPALSEVVVTGYGVQKKEFRGDLSEHTDVDEQTLNTVYTIDLPYDLPSTGKDQVVTLQNKEVRTLFKYLAVPKKSPDVYLLADIPDWGKLNLLPGKANIVLNGTYVGKTTINPASTQDTLHLTVGKDKRIVVERRKVSDFASEKFLNANQYHKYVYEISLLNNKREGVTLMVLDQIPLSTNKDIAVALDDAGNATVNAEKGELRWSVTLKSGESGRVHFGYTVKYPKDEQVTMR